MDAPRYSDVEIVSRLAEILRETLPDLSIREAVDLARATLESVVETVNEQKDLTKDPLV